MGKRGQKTCKSCGSDANGPRSKNCSACKAPFTFKTETEGPSLAQMRKKKDRVAETPCDWKTLQKGDRIRVVQGSGPYFPQENADSIPMNYVGKFTVLKLGKDVIHAIGDKEGNAHCIIYMGETVESPYGLIREAHKVIKLKARKEKNSE